MRHVELAKQLWPKAKFILLPWDGSATEVFKARDMCFYIWVDGRNQSHEIEMIFWNDLHFPKTVFDEQHITTWERIVGFTEQIREGTLNSKCIFTPKHNGPVEELFDHKSTVVW